MEKNTTSFQEKMVVHETSSDTLAPYSVKAETTNQVINTSLQELMSWSVLAVGAEKTNSVELPVFFTDESENQVVEQPLPQESEPATDYEFDNMGGWIEITKENNETPKDKNNGFDFYV